MSKIDETFFTVVGCMDGRVQEPVAAFGRKRFGAKFADTITEPGIVGLIPNDPSPTFIKNLKFKLLVSIDKHHSEGVIVDGHQECAGNPVSDKQHKDDVRKSVEFVRNLAKNKIPVVGIFVFRSNDGWKVEEI